MNKLTTIELVKTGASYGPKRQSTTRRVVCFVAALLLFFFGVWLVGITLYTDGGRFHGLSLLGGVTLAGIAGAWIYEDFIKALPVD